MRKLLTIILLILSVSHTGNIRAQLAFNGDLSMYADQVETAISHYYLLSLECIQDPDNQDRMISSMKQTYLMPSGVYIPDCMKYDNQALLVSYENYVLSIAGAYKELIKRNADIYATQKNLKILQAEWTQDRKGIVLNAVYDNEFKINGKTHYRGKSQAVVCFPDITNQLDYRFKQITPFGRIPEKPAARVTFADAMKSYRSHDYKQSLAQFLYLAEQGNPDALGFVGNHYLNGLGVGADTVKSQVYYRQTFEYDTPYTQYFQAICYLEGRCGLKPDTLRAIKLAKYSAAAKNPYGTTLLGTCYQYGIGIKKDRKKAKKLFQKGMKMGHPNAYTKMGLMHFYIHEADYDEKRGFQLINKSIELGATDYGLLSFLYRMGIGCDTDIDKAIHYAKKGIEVNDYYSFGELALCYWGKREEQPELEQEAIRLFELADEKKDYLNNNILADYYYRKNRQSYWKKALGYMESYVTAISAMPGHKVSGKDHYLLSEIYLNHTGEKGKAYHHIQAAYEDGHAEAIDKIGDYYYYGDGMENANPQLAYKYYKEAIEKGYGVNSYFGLGACYMYGYGVSKDMDKSIRYFEQGASKGYPLCCNMMGLLYYNGTDSIRKDLKKAEELFTTGSKNPQIDGAAACMATLGLMHALNKASHPDSERARSLWQQSDELCDSDAPYYMGHGYEYGLYGYPKDTNQALSYYRKASNRGNENATRAYKKLTEKETTTKK